MHPIKVIAKSILPPSARAAALRAERAARGMMAERCRGIARLCEQLASRLAK
jgi:hypothetical protein